MTNKWVFLVGAGILVAAAPRSFAQGAATAIARLGSDSIDERRAAATAVASLGAPGLEDADAIAEQLGDLRRDGDGRVANLMSELLPRDPRSHDEDIVTILVERRPDRSVEHALATICLMRALARIGTTPAIRQLVRTASDVGGAFRPELSRELKQLDERATAALIEARGDPSFEMRTWAKDALEALGKRTPGDAVQTTNDGVLADVLHAYAAIRDLDALPVIVSFINSERTHVREAAREATLAFGQDALGKLRATHAALTGERLSDNANAAEVASKLFDAYDRYRLRDVYERLDQGLAKERNGDIDGAIADFDTVLARQPVLDRSAEIIPAYVRYAEGIEPSNRARALEYLRKALRLYGTFAVPSGSRTEAGNSAGGPAHVQGEILYLEAEDLIAIGVEATGPFERALALDPTNARARARLAGLRAKSRSLRTRDGRIAVAVGTTGLSLVTMALFALHASRNRAESKFRTPRGARASRWR